MTLPNFLIIGANKSGTTSLFHYLRQHPQIFMPDNKEPMYFLYAGSPIPPASPGLDRFLKFAINDLSAYEHLFDSVTDHRAVGEASTAYLMGPKCPDRIRKLLPGARLIALLRDPASRAYSNFLHHERIGFVDVSFEEAISGALDDDTDPFKEGSQLFQVPLGVRYLRLGLYSRGLRRYLESFPRDQLFVRLFEDFMSSPRSLVTEVHRFLGVDESFPADTTMRHNVAGPGRPGPRVAKFLRIVKHKLGKGRWGTSETSSKREIPRPLRQRLVDYYRRDVLDLQELIDRDLSSWLRVE